MKTVKTLLLFAAIGVLALLYSDAFCFELRDLALYFGTTDESITVKWDHNDPLPDRYEVHLYHVERDTEEPAGIGGGPGNSLTFYLPRSGHFVAWVRACEGETCGDWSESTDPAVATVNGEARGWWIYGHVAPPGPIIINEGP